MASVPTASVFSLPLKPWQQPRSVRVTHYEPRKRKHHDDWADNDDGAEGDTTDAASDVAPGPSLTLSPDEARQYRTAGLSFDKEIPGGNFPHGPAKARPTRPQTEGRVLEELTKLSSPIFPPQSAAHEGNLRLQHLAVLSSILHRCLLEGDYIRAGKAWGLILREEIEGHSIDVRAEGRWGIGAEILLRRGRGSSDMASEHAMEDDGTHPAVPSSGLFFTREGFEHAKEYYEQLIIQHPYRKYHHDAINPLCFYPAMFGLWVYVAQEESKVSRQRILDNTRDDYSEDEDAASEFRGHASSKQKTHALLASIRKNELGEAQKIAARMDEIIVSPPYSDSSELLELRAMISSWIADLHVSSLPGAQAGGRMDASDSDFDSDADENRSVSADDIQESLQERRERRLALERKEAESQRSQDFFDKARQRGAGQPRPRTTEASNQSRQALAAQARVEVPATTLIAPVPLPLNKPVSLEHYGAASFAEQVPQAPADNMHRDMFDTDVEGIDDSTIAATSVLGADDVPLQYQLRPATVPQHQDAGVDDERPLYPSRLPRRAYDGKWYENLGDSGMRSTGFDSEDVDNASQLTSMGGDDERSDSTDDPDYARRYRTSTDEPLSKRLQNFWSASRRSHQNPENTAYAEPSKGLSLRQSTTDARMTNPVTGNRKVTLPRSMTATPRTRFSPPKPSLLEQLDLTPTRRASGPRPQPGKETGITSIDHRDSDDDAHLFDPGHRRHDSLPPLNTFDMTNLDDLDPDPINDPFSRRASVQRITPDTPPPSKKRTIEPDYPPHVLRQKTFQELQSEPFDYTPTAAPTEPTPTVSNNSAPGPEATPEEKMAFLFNAPDKGRRDFFSTLSINEWEDYGDLLIDQFSAALTKMKDLRHARRKTAAAFEAEVKRRHDDVEEQSTDLSKKFEEMRNGGAEVLRGRTPGL
ncbi:hypothetical protein BO71DRAFT_452520 [Aspergillus ellipticus CBS 707.79]|uniref:Extracellular mutant protein 11 C-terminal domain-containing protein n=1 Tax=Aspergillus ellipticus CBS 707.79 TaxID=1448320 RepID=A0A319D1D4_9EURO|nr:hypothetical protein BO71DRAFT_452520 [Aspergillus ellipticus CBS 707.79]